MENPQNFVFVYAKESEIKVLNIENAKILHKQLLEVGWLHTQTLDACMYIEYLHNHCDEVDLIEEVNSLTKSITK